MQNKNLVASLLVASALASPVVGAVTYPAGFEPEVIYQDSDYISKSGGGSAAAPAPAAPAAKPAKADTTKYPAGFEPEVLYRDDAAIKKATGSAKIAASASAETSAPSTAASAPKEGSPLTENAPLIGVGALALLGLFFWKRRAAAPAGEIAAAAPAAVAPAGRLPGETGVSSYLRNALGVTVETGVSKYLKGIQGAASAAAETGVAKYLKGLPATSAAGGAETGVAKYLKKVG